MNKSFILACTLTCLSASAQKANVFSISTTERHQEIDCFGASDAWSMQFFGNIAQPVQDNVARWLFSSETDAKGNPEGIALSLWRFNLGAGSAEQGDSSRINSVARIIHHDLVLADARSWQWWRAVGGDYKDGLLFQYREPQAVADTIVDSKLLWALGHYSRFVRPKAVRLGVTKNGDTSTEKATDPNALMCSAFENADGSQVVVVINYAQQPQTVSIDGLKRGNWRVYRTSDAPNESLALVGKLQKLANITIPARSITTITNMRMK